MIQLQARTARWIQDSVSCIQREEVPFLVRALWHNHFKFLNNDFNNNKVYLLINSNLCLFYLHCNLILEFVHRSFCLHCSS